jgi:hypothetical protein
LPFSSQSTELLRFMSQNPWLAPIFAIAGCSLLLLANGSDLMFRAIRMVAYARCRGFPVPSVSGYFSRIPSRPGLWRHLSESAYAVYLFYHLLVIASRLLVVNMDLPVAVKFAAVNGFSLCGSYAIHRGLISKVSALSWMFNVRTLRKQIGPKIRIVGQTIEPGRARPTHRRTPRRRCYNWRRDKAPKQ